MPNISARDRRRQFIAATVAVISEEGVSRATTRRIADRAGAPAASVHYCFETKEELFQAVLEEGLLNGLAYVGKEVRPGMGVAAAVGAIMRGFAHWMIEDWQTQQAQWELTLWALRSPASRHLPQRIYRRYLLETRHLLAEASAGELGEAELDVIARQMIAALDGLGLQRVALGDDSLLSMVDVAIATLQSSLPSQGTPQRTSRS